MIRLANYSPYKWIIYLAIKNLLQYDKNMKIIKVKHGTSTFVHFFLRKFLLKLTLKPYVIYTIVITQSWFRPRTLAHLQWEKKFRMKLPLSINILWRDRNTSFSKMRGRYDRVRCMDNFNHKKVIICRYRYEFSQLTSLPAFAYHCLWLQTW